MAKILWSWVAVTLVLFALAVAALRAHGQQLGHYSDPRLLMVPCPGEPRESCDKIGGTCCATYWLGEMNDVGAPVMPPELPAPKLPVLVLSLGGGDGSLRWNSGSGGVVWPTITWGTGVTTDAMVLGGGGASAMPCDSGPSYGDTMYEQLQRATRAACDLTKVLRRLSPRMREVYFQSLMAETRAWIAEHDELDRKREAEEERKRRRERRRKEALKKLTPEDREALGLR